MVGVGHTSSSERAEGESELLSFAWAINVNLNMALNWD